MTKRTIEIEHRGMRAWAFGRMMRIQTLSGINLAGTNEWDGAELTGVQAKTAKLRHDVDEFLRLEWFFIRKGGRKNTLDYETAMLNPQLRQVR